MYIYIYVYTFVCVCVSTYIHTHKPYMHHRCEIQGTRIEPFEQWLLKYEDELNKHIAPASPALATSAEGRATNAPSAEGRATNAPSAEGRATNAPSAEGRATHAPSAEGRATHAPSAEGRATNAPSAEGRATNAPSASRTITEAKVGADKKASDVDAAGETENRKNNDNDGMNRDQELNQSLVYWNMQRLQESTNVAPGLEFERAMMTPSALHSAAVDPRQQNAQTPMKAGNMASTSPNDLLGQLKTDISLDPLLGPGTVDSPGSVNPVDELPVIGAASLPRRTLGEPLTVGGLTTLPPWPGTSADVLRGATKAGGQKKVLVDVYGALKMFVCVCVCVCVRMCVMCVCVCA